MKHASPARAVAPKNVAVLVATMFLPLLLMQCISSAASEVKTTAAAPAAALAATPAGAPAAAPAAAPAGAPAAAATPARKPLRILAIMTVGTMSHHIWMSALTVELAKRGHLVTSIDIHEHSENPPTLNTT
ncbi:UDP-glycosyltransferase-31, partial [Frankliniella occidentalis]